jgi:hypothetical protein
MHSILEQKKYNGIFLEIPIMDHWPTQAKAVLNLMNTTAKDLFQHRYLSYSDKIKVKPQSIYREDFYGQTTAVQVSKLLVELINHLN